MQGMRTLTQPPSQGVEEPSKEAGSSLNYSVSNASTISHASTFSHTSTSSALTTDSETVQLGNSTNSDQFCGSLTNASSTDTGIDLNENHMTNRSPVEFPVAARVSIAERKANFLLRSESTNDSKPTKNSTTTSTTPKTLEVPSLRNSPFVQKDARRIKLQKVAAELLQTEQSYSAALDLLDVHLRERLQPPLLTADQLHQLLGPFTPLRKLSAHFIEQFGSCLARWEQKPKIAHVLVKFGPFLKQYGDFGSKFDSINTLFADLYKKNSGKHGREALRICF